MSCVNSYRDLIQLNRIDLGVYQIPYGQVGSITAILQDLKVCMCLCMCEKMNVHDLCIFVPPEACTWWSECVCVTPRAGMWLLIFA